MSLKHFLAILRARWLIAVTVLGVVFTTALVLTLVMPKRYTATAKVMIDLRSSDPLSGMLFAGQLPPSYIGTQVDIITSERVGRRVVKTAKLDESPQFREQWREDTDGRGSFETWAVGVLSQALIVQQSRESSAIEIGYMSNDPNLAAALANAFMQAYIDVSLDMRVEPAKRYGELFASQAAQLRKDVETTQTKLSAFQQANRIIDTDERLDIENARLNDLSNQLVLMQTAAIDSSSRQAQASANSDRMQEVLNSPVVAGLKADIARGEGRLKELQSRFGDAHPQVVESHANLKELRVRLDQEIRRVGSSVGVNNSVNKSREAQLRAALDAQRARVLELKRIRDEANVLRRDVEAAQRAYDGLMQKLNQSALESQANQTNISVLQSATPPVDPSFPKLWLNLLLALILGTGLAGVTAFVMELTAPRVRTQEAILGLKVLAVIPDTSPRKGPLIPALPISSGKPQKLLPNA